MPSQGMYTPPRRGGDARPIFIPPYIPLPPPPRTPSASSTSFYHSLPSTAHFSSSFRSANHTPQFITYSRLKHRSPLPPPLSAPVTSVDRDSLRYASSVRPSVCVRTHTHARTPVPCCLYVHTYIHTYTPLRGRGHILSSCPL